MELLILLEVSCCDVVRYSTDPAQYRRFGIPLTLEGLSRWFWPVELSDPLVLPQSSMRRTELG